MNRTSIADNASPYNKKNAIVKTQAEPDAIVYSSFFYAPHHVPSYQERPGNNTIKTEVYTRYVSKIPHMVQDNYANSSSISHIQTDYNLYCYNNKSTTTSAVSPADECWPQINPNQQLRTNHQSS